MDTTQTQPIAPAHLPGHHPLTCGVDGWWCHATCFRHEACQYVRLPMFADEPTETVPKPRTLDDILTEHCRRTG